MSRDNNCERAVRLMQERQRLRTVHSTNSIAARDKSSNRLIALPGCKGIGKSTFMAHFPESPEFTNYVIQRSKESPIVAPLSFNSAMNGGGSMLGLRILYGALASMVTNSVSQSMISWTDFYGSLLKFNDLSAIQAISILRSAYGLSRPVLILVDEISKAGSEEVGKEVMKQIGVVLDDDGNTDVIVSSLSPNYVETLLSGSNRDIEYCVLLPLLDVNLVGDICKLWKDRLIKKYRQISNEDQFIPRVLESMPLLASGHPRSIEWVNRTKILDGDDNWKQTIRSLQSGANAASLIQSLTKDLNDLSDFNRYGILKDPDLCFNATLSWDLINPRNDSAARSLIETNGLFLIPDKPKDTNAFRFAMRLGTFSNYLPSVARETKSPIVHAAFALFGSVFYDNIPNISIWWERAVLLTIISRTMSGNLDIFGSLNGSLINMYRSTNCSYLSIRLSETQASLKQLIEGELTSTPLNFQGADGIVILMGNAIYLQMKIAKSKGKNRARVFFKAVRSILQTHFLLYPNIPLSKVSVVFYEWSYINDAEKETLVSDINKMFNEWAQRDASENTNKFFRKNDPSINDDELENLVINFLSKIDGFVINSSFCSTNVHFIDRSILNTWLLPTLAPIPRLVQAIEDSDI